MDPEEEKHGHQRKSWGGRVGGLGGLGCAVKQMLNENVELCSSDPRWGPEWKESRGDKCS